MNRLTNVVKNLIIINVIVFFAINSLNDIYPGLKSTLMLHSTSADFKPYQIITHMFMHANFSHLFFNMFGLFIFGPMVEDRVGMKKFFQLYFLSGLFALILHFSLTEFENYSNGIIVHNVMLGASGALMGIVAAFSTLFPNVQLMLLFPPIPIKAKYIAIGYVVLDLFQNFNSPNDGVAHYAHIGGAILGFLLIKYWQKKGFL